MTKVSITGPKKRLEDVIEQLHKMQILDITTFEGELERGNPAEGSEKLSETLVDLRSVLSKLPEVDSEKRNIDVSELPEELKELSKDIENIQSEINDCERSIDEIKNTREFYKKLRGLGLDKEDLQGSKTTEVFIGDFETEIFQEKIGTDMFELFEGENAKAVIYSKKQEEKITEALESAGATELTFRETNLEGTPRQILDGLESEKKEFERKKGNYERDLEKLASTWRGTLEAKEEYLSERIEKAEAPLEFAVTDNMFIAEGWVPKERYSEMKDILENSNLGNIHVQREEAEEEPPVKHENSRAVQPFESLTDLVSIPQYKEIDPSIVLLLTFPLFFGFMIGDAGYGLTTLAVFYAGYKMFPGAKDIFKSLMYASVATIIFGLAFGDAFGYVLFGHHSDLAHITGIHLFEQIPIIFHRAEHLGQVFNWSILIGFAHINIGYLIGMYNETWRHGVKEAFLEKGSWLVLEAGVLLAAFVSPTAGIPVVLLSLIMLYLGEGIAGLVEIPALLSNILSYLRIFGVSVAAVSLAGVVNAMAQPLFQGGSAIGFAAGIFLLMVGHVFNTFIKILEGFLQGIRLHYVEMFGKFYHGGGKKYAPFGARKFD